MPNLSASGRASVTGHAQAPSAAAPVALSGRAGALFGGHLAVSSGFPAGGVADFAYWSPGAVDPAISRLASLIDGYGTTTGNGTVTWAQGWLSALAPSAYDRGAGPLWGPAVYAAVGASFTNMGAGQSAGLFTDVQLEKAVVGNLLSADASTFATAMVWGADSNSTYTRSADKAYGGSYSGKLTITGTGATWIGPLPTPKSVAPVQVGTVAGQAWVSATKPVTWQVFVAFFDANLNQVSTTTAVQKTHPGDGSWQQAVSIGAKPVSTPAYMTVMVQVSSTGLAVGDTVYIDALNLVPYYDYWVPSPYQPARQLNITVLADRINHVKNPGFDNDTWGWTTAPSAPSSFTSTWDNTVGRTRAGSIRAVFLNGTSPGSFYLIGTNPVWVGGGAGVGMLTPGATYTVSMYVQLASGCPPVSIYAGFPLSTTTAPVIGQSTFDVANHAPGQIEGAWTRLALTFTMPVDCAGIVQIGAGMAPGAVGAGGTCWIDDVLIESGNQLLPYFDGNSVGTDYLWESTPMRSRTHYYKGLRSAKYRVNQAVADAVPVGAPFQILYAQPS